MLQEIDNPFHGIEGLPKVLPMYGKEIPKRDLRRITSEQAYHSQIGDVLLVRSNGVSDLGDHYIIVVGGLVDKPNGRRPQVMVVPAPMNNPLSMYGDDEIMVALKLEKQAKEELLQHYGINVEGELVTMSGNTVHDVKVKAQNRYDELNRAQSAAFTDAFRDTTQAEMSGIKYVLDLLNTTGC